MCKRVLSSFHSRFLFYIVFGAVVRFYNLHIIFDRLACKYKAGTSIPFQGKSRNKGEFLWYSRACSDLKPKLAYKFELNISVYKFYSLFLLTPSLPECLMEFCKATLTFKSADEILRCDHSNESY